MQNSLSAHLDVWEQELQGDKDRTFILEGIKKGFSIIDSSHALGDIQPSVTDNHPSTSAPSAQNKVEAQINKELEDGNYIVSENNPVITSALAAVPKKDGAVRLIHDCSRPKIGSVNSYASKDECKYQTVSDALAFVQPGWYMCKVDLQAAYRSVGIDPREQPLLGIRWKFKNSDSYTYMEDTKLPFGARKSPSIFNTITQAVRRMLDRHGVRCVVLLDDFFITAPTFEECKEHLNTTITLIRSLGFRINWRKVVDPTQELVFLGIHINTVTGRLSLDPDKVTELLETIRHAQSCSRQSKTQLQSLAGKLLWASHVIEWGRSFINSIFSIIKMLVKDNHKAETVTLRQDLNWWQKALSNGLYSRRIWDHRQVVTMQTDACQAGGGAFCYGSWLYVNWQLDTTLALAHINCKELASVAYALEVWGPAFRGKELLVYTDNLATVAFINKQRAPNNNVRNVLSCMALTALKFDIKLVATYIPGDINELADSISRLNEPGQLIRFMTLLERYYSSTSAPMPHFFWLPDHMSMSSMLSLSQPLERWTKTHSDWSGSLTRR